MPLRGNMGSIKGALKALPRTVAADVAKRAAPALSKLTNEAFTSNRTVYGEARPVGVSGRALSLVQTGATRDALRFVSVGSIVRCVLPTPWAKYLIGKYGVLPNGSIPVRWSARLGALVAETKVKP